MAPRLTRLHPLILRQYIGHLLRRGVSVTGVVPAAGEERSWKTNTAEGVVGNGMWPSETR